MTKRRWMILVAVMLALMLAGIALLLLMSRDNGPPLSESARFVCAQLVFA